MPLKSPLRFKRGSNHALGPPAFWGLVLIAGIVLVALWLRPPAPEPPQWRPIDVPSRGDVVTRPEARSESEPLSDNPAYGRLRQTSDGVYESAAGLRYRQGGADGHRIDHILRHARDAPERPVHGVFAGTRDDILGVIDEAYSIARQRGPPDVRVRREDSRTVYTVKLGRKIGYLGGQSGKRQRHPPLTHLRLVLEGRDVITAFPVRP